MDTDKRTDFSELLDKQLNRTSNFEEQKKTAELIQSMSDEDIYKEVSTKWNGYTPTKHLSDDKSEQILNNILEQTKRRAYKKRIMKLFISSSAAAACIIIAILAGLYFGGPEKYTTAYKVIAKAVIAAPTKAVSFDRHLTLPDGSTVILKNGSRLSYPNQFNGQTREVTLQGEAYFDIKHKESQPFIIHTGHIRTVVLGTAFNIKADKGSVAVTVTRGRVKVDKDGKTLAILSINQEIVCNNENSVVAQSVQKEGTEIQWVKNEMDFDHVSMTEVAKVISHRYGVNVSIDNPELEKLIFISEFTGTESLDDVLSVLCSLMPDMNYKIIGNNVIINKSSK